MREIKFRGKAMDDEWVVGGLVITAVGLIYIIPQNLISDTLEGIIVSKKTVGEYIGIKDKNGKEIYESDLVEDNVGIGFVEFINGAYRVNYRNGICKWFIDFLDSEKRTLEVIGNVYEHPHLLEGTTNE